MLSSLPAREGTSLPESAWALREDDESAYHPAAFFDDAPELRAYLGDFGRLQVELLRFVWVRGGCWYQAELRAVDGASAPTRGAELYLVRGAPGYGLTLKELDVLTLMACGLTNGEAADRLSLSRSTIGTHVERILAKLGQPTRSAAAAVAVEQHLLRLPLPGEGGPLTALRIGELDSWAQQAELRATDAADEPAALARPRRSRSRARPLLLGSLYPAGADGADMRLGSRLAIDEINRRGGAGGRDVEHLVVEADVADAASVLDGLDALEEAGADGIVCAYVSDESAVPDVLEFASRFGGPFLHTLGSRVAVERVRRRPAQLGNVFQLCPSIDGYNRGFLQFVRGGARRGTLAADSGRVMILGDDPARTGAIPATRAGEAAGGLAVEGVVLDHDLESWQAAARRVSREAPDAVLLSTFDPPSIVAFLDEFLAHPSPTLLYGLWVPGTPVFPTASGRYDGLVWSSNSGRHRDPVSARFEARFAARFPHQRPGLSAGLQYDAVNLLAHAWSTVPHPRAFREVSTVLRENVYRGVNGTYYFGASGQSSLAYPDDVSDSSLAHTRLTYQIQDGVSRVIAPGTVADARYVRPWWLAG
jgi:branched-chain amino acid transport system substrate-binding protein